MNQLPAQFHYVELLGRSNFSFLQGASHAEEMVYRAQELGYQGIALCDLNGLYGAVRGYREAYVASGFVQKGFIPSSGFQYHAGSEVVLRDRSSIALLPSNKKGYANLCRLLTIAKRPSPKGFSNLDYENVIEYSSDLLAFPLPPWNETRLLFWREVFQDRLHLPVWKDFTWESKCFYLQALDLESRLGFSLFATQRPFMHTRERKRLHDVLTCILHKTTLKDSALLLLPNAERHLRSLPELYELWRERPDLLSKTVNIANQVQFKLTDLRYKYPKGDLPPGMTSMDRLRELCAKGIQTRFPDGISLKAKMQMQKEFALIEELKYEDYFLTLWDICQFAIEREILFQGRGSAANSVVCYLLGLTAVSPEKIDLLFERFISKERNEPPDIDLDFEHERREEVIQYIYQRYGNEHAAMVCNVICYRTRMAIREICKVLEVPEEKVSRMVAYMGREGFSRLKENPEIFKKWDLDPAKFQLILQLVSELRGFPRHLGIHSGGFVISQNSLLDCVPVEKATMEDRFVVQWNKDDIETLGLMKIDFLSLGMLTALRKALHLLRDHKGIHLGLREIPDDDLKTYQMIQKADTVGTFQIESRAQMSLLPRLKPGNFYDLVIEVAIVRPGPIQGGMVHPYLRRRDGLEKTTYAHPKLEPILKRTLGIPIFQEQIMQMVEAVAGFTPGEADQMRRIMSNAWRKQAQMDGLRDKIFSGMRASGIQERYIEQVYKTIEGFASYGFPESHSASFALLTYASCYLKCQHPDAFVCALLNSQPLGFYSPRALIMDAQRHGVKFTPLSLHHSDEDYTMEPPGPNDPSPRPSTEVAPIHPVRVGFRSILGLAQKHIQTLLTERKANGFFTSLSDLLKRTRLPSHALLRLAAAGAFADLGWTAREALWQVQSLCLDQNSLFFARANSTDSGFSTPQPTAWEEVKREYESTGFSLDSHPLAILRPALQLKNQSLGKNPYVTSSDLPRIAHQSRLRFAGLLNVQQKPPTAKGVSFLTLEDENGFFNIVLAPKVYETYRLLLMQSTLLEVHGRLEKVQGVYNVLASHIEALRPELFIQIPTGLPPEIEIEQRMFH
jgi:DNA-directed DNA polymerase III PolC